MRSLLVLSLLVLPAAVTAGPQVGGCAIFPSDNAWNVRVDQLPVHARSAEYIFAVGASVKLHPDFGSGLYEGAPMGIPFVVAGKDTPKVSVKFDYPGESDPGPYPIPAGAPIEGGPNAKTGDRHVLVVDKDNCVLYETFASVPQSDGSWQAGSGAVFDLKSNALRPLGWTSADAAGLPILPGLVRYDEVAAGEIQHAIRLTVPKTQRAIVWPARHFASSITDPTYPAMGQRFRLRADYDISKFPPQARVIARALKQYGMILADNGSAWFISGAPDDRWDNEQLATLKVITGADLEAVDASALREEADSAKVRTAAYSPGVLNAASLRPGPIAPGELIALKPGGNKAAIDGIAAPLLYTSDQQINAIVPWASAHKSSVQIEIEDAPGSRRTVPMDIAPYSPAIFTKTMTGEGQGAILNQNMTENSAANPASKDTVIAIYATGGGVTTPASSDGEIIQDGSKMVQGVTARIGGVNAIVEYAGGAPLLVAGVLQVNVRIPKDAPSGPAVPVLLTIGGLNSQPEVTVAIQ